MLHTKSHATDIDPEDVLIFFCGNLGYWAAGKDACIVKGNVETPEMVDCPIDKCRNVFLAAYIGVNEHTFPPDFLDDSD
jgi:hypothetical protein